MQFSRSTLISVCLPLLFASCGSAPKLPTGNQFPTPPPPEYASRANWAALPTVKDNADRTPGEGFTDRQATAKADVFFLHPTVYRSTTESSQDWNANLFDEEINETVDDRTILNQASIFNAAGRVYAPRYRQANLSVYYDAGRAVADRAFDVAYQDVLAAFDYFVANYNDGRPIIIASHSQGTTHAKRLLRDRFEGQPIRDRLVAAYLVGMPVAANAYPTIPVCQSAKETGCFVSWRTYRRISSRSQATKTPSATLPSSTPSPGRPRPEQPPPI